MPTNGSSFEKDEKTGYLQPKKETGTTVFGVESKKKFLDVYKETGSMTKACEIVGISYTTFRHHCELDEAFVRDVQITMKLMEHTLEGAMYKKALEPNGTMDRFGWLRAHNPSKWNPKTNVVVSQDNASLETLFSALKDSGKLIDVDSSNDTSDSIPS